MADQIALVTGGRSGIGAEIVRHMLEQGYEVISLSRRPTPPQRGLVSVEVDLKDATATAEAAADIARRFPVSHFVHNAGLIRAAALADIKPDDMPVLAQVHLNAPVLLLQTLLPAMQQARFGRVVLIASRAALGMPTRTVYGATKAGMLSMARTWALELARHGITVNVVAPGPTEGTEMYHSVIPKDSERHHQLARSIPVGRVGMPGDIARAVMFFAAPDNGFVTGQTLYVCGGASLGAFSM